MDATFSGSTGRVCAYDNYLPRQKKHHPIAENVWAFSSRRMQHLNIRYYFITDQIKKGHIKVAFCFTQEIIVFFTKPLQGALFVYMWEKIFNLPTSTIADIHRSVLKERIVGDKDPKINRKTKVPISVGGNKNSREESKVNKTGKNKTEYIQE